MVKHVVYIECITHMKLSLSISGKGLGKALGLNTHDEVAIK